MSFHKHRHRVVLLLVVVASFALAELAFSSLALAEEETHISVETTDEVAEIFAGGVPTDLADLRAMQSHIQKLSKQLIPATVSVQVGGAAGSGVIIDEEGHVLTAAHVCGEPDRNVTFIFPNGKRVKGKTLGVNRGIDAGLMKITDKGDWPHIPVGDYDTVNVGQWVLAIGHPGGYDKARGAVVRLGRVLTKRNGVINTDCTLVGGDSGGPLFDMNGNVIGIHSRIGGSIASNMHVPIKTYTETWDRLVAAEDWGGIIPRGGPFIGVVGEPESDQAKIAEVHDDSPAAKAGIKPDDVIIEFAGEKIQNFTDLAGIVRKQKPGKKVKVKVKRGDETVELELKVGRRG